MSNYETTGSTKSSIQECTVTTKVLSNKEITSSENGTGTIVDKEGSTSWSEARSTSSSSKTSCSSSKICSSKTISGKKLTSGATGKAFSSKWAETIINEESLSIWAFGEETISYKATVEESSISNKATIEESSTSKAIIKEKCISVKKGIFCSKLS